jgi:Plant calmodulin-binding domain
LGSANAIPVVTFRTTGILEMSGEFTRKPSITHRRKTANLCTVSNSSTSPTISNSKPIPNYLKAPAFSCHDLCKYGHRHGLESKCRPLVRPKKRADSGIRGVVLNPELCVSRKKERLKREVVVSESIAPPKEDAFVDKEATFVEDATFDVPRGRIEMDAPEKIFETSGPSSVREIKMFGEELSVNSSSVVSRHVYVPLAEDSLRMKVAASHSDGTHDDTLTSESDVVVEIPPKNESAKMMELAKNAKVTPINGSELCNGKRGEIVRKNIERQKVDQVSLKPNVTRKRDTVPKDGSLKRAGGASIQPRPREKTAMLLVQTNKPRLSINSTPRPVKGDGEGKVLKPVKKPAFVKSPTKSLRKLKKGKGPTSPPRNNQSSSGGSASNSENTKEKTIYMIEAKQEVSPDCNQVKKVTKKGKLSSASSSSVSEKDLTSSKNLVSQSYTKPPLPPHKMTFCRGKVINVQAETNVPTRIKFRRAKSNVINKAEGAMGVNKVARKKRDSGYLGATKSTPSSGTPAVALRHQNSPQDKNGAAVSLFNHVIEETASKLVETRKSKVKALVGAFETVISLQDKSTVPSPS